MALVPLPPRGITACSPADIASPYTIVCTTMYEHKRKEGLCARSGREAPRALRSLRIDLPVLPATSPPPRSSRTPFVPPLTLTLTLTPPSSALRHCICCGRARPPVAGVYSRPSRMRIPCVPERASSSALSLIVWPVCARACRKCTVPWCRPPEVGPGLFCCWRLVVCACEMPTPRWWCIWQVASPK